MGDPRDRSRVPDGARPEPYGRAGGAGRGASGVSAPPASWRTRATARWLAVVGLGAGACGFAVLAFGVEAKDDDAITFWAAQELVRSGHLVNVNGTRLEQSSSLAYVGVLAALDEVTHAPMPVLAYVVGLVALVATVVASARLARRVRPAAELPAAACVAVAFPLVFWATGGLETLLAAAASLWFVSTLAALVDAVVLGRGHVVGFAAATVLVVTVRPDTMVVAVALALGVALDAAIRAASGPRLRRWLPAVPLRRGALVAAIVLCAAAALAAARLAAFGHVLPQPDLAKVGGPSWFATGFSYVFGSLPWWLWVVLLALFGVGAAWVVATRSLLGTALAAWFALGVASICFTRGDWMGAGRLLVPYLAPGIVVAAIGASTLRRTRRLATAALLAAEVASLLALAGGVTWLSSQYVSPSGASQRTAFEADVGSPFGATITATGPVPAMPWYVRWDYLSARDAVFLASATPALRALLAARPGTVTIGSYQAGVVISTWQQDFPGRLRFVDMDDVVTDDFSTCPGLRQTYGGDVITLVQWAHDAGGCAPPLPDLVLFLRAPSQTPGVVPAYRVVSLVTMTYRQHHLLGASELLGNTEYLAARVSWLDGPRQAAGGSPRTRGTGTAPPRSPRRSGAAPHAPRSPRAAGGATSLARATP